MKDRLWWHKPLRVIQTNLQVKDTGLMNPEKIVREIDEMAGNVLVINTGGIYAWYRSKVKYHHINEYLPEDFDLLGEIIHECHKRNIRVVARFDFSKTHDYIFQQRPQWFVRDLNKKPRIYGKDRMGVWSLLLSTCINEGYRNDEVAVPVLNEVLDTYDIDGIFFNAPHYELCHCDTCKAKYYDIYKKPLPENPDDFERNWPSLCLKDNMDKLRKTVKAKRADVHIILYYGLYNDNLYDRTATADMICTEPQDVLSLGWDRIPPSWRPTLSIKMGRTLENYPKPFGIVHSCPGMDWRHTGLPTAEYMFWMSQIPASGGHIWHSITGFNDTISDKRIIKSVSDINHMIKKSEDYMDNAKPVSQTLLLWNSQQSSDGWAEGLTNTQVLFDILDNYQITLERLKNYKVVIIPENFDLSDDNAGIIKDYVEEGGSIIIEGTKKDSLLPILDIIGIEIDIVTSEYLAASYLRFEGGDNQLQKGLENTPLIPHRGMTAYCKPNEDTRVLATLVPPFAPLDAVGAPPERASILTPRTDLPLITLHEYGSGKVLFLSFQLSMLIREYKLNEHHQLVKNCVDMLLGRDRIFNMNRINGIQVNMYKKDNYLLIHFVNGIGQRPLVNNIPYHNLDFSVRLEENTRVKRIFSCIAGEKIEYTVEEGQLNCALNTLNVWDMVVVETEEIR